VEETGYHSGANNPTKWYGAAADAKNPRGCGFELEVERITTTNSSNRQKAQLIKELRLEYGDLIRSIEHDGSLSDGLEIVSQPITYTAYSRTNWDNFFAIIKKHGYAATRNTGLHLHIDRYVLGRDRDNNRERKQSLAKLAYLTVKEYGLFRRLSGREEWETFADEQDSVYWARNLTSPRTGFYWDTSKPMKDEAIRWAEESHGHYTSSHYWRGLPSHDYRYRILNTDNEHTIEWRIGSATLDPDAFIAWIDFLGTVTRNALRISWDNVDNLDKWLEGISPETLKFYNKKYNLSL